MPLHLLGRKTPEFKGFTKITLIRANRQRNSCLCGEENGRQRLLFLVPVAPPPGPGRRPAPQAATVDTGGGRGQRGWGAGTG